jgi:hypothetical protein
MKAFEHYLIGHNIEPIRLSIAAGVRYMTIYNAMNEKPISPEHAQKIGVALYRLTGEVYTGPLPVLTEPPIDQLPTVPLQRIKRTSRL